MTSAAPVREKGGASGREGKLDLSVPQVAGSAVAAVVAAKLASNLGVYGTIVGAGVVSVLGTCGGSLLQHFFRRTGRHVQEVAVQARPGVRRVRGQAWSRTGTATAVDGTRLLPAPDAAGTQPPAGENPPTGAVSGTGLAAAPAGGAGDPGHMAGGGYGEPTSYRAGRRSRKRPVVAVALAFGLTMGGITCYEAVAGENISGHGHGTTIGNAVTGHGSPKSGGTDHAPVPGGTGTPSGGTTTGPQSRDGDQRHSGKDATPSAPQPSATPSTGADGTGNGTGTSGGSPTSAPATPPQTTPASPSPTATPTDGSGGSDSGSGTGSDATR